MKETMERIKKFRDDRDWQQFHTPSNLAKAISIESGELLEEFLWDNDNFNLQNVKEELADVMIYCIHMANALDVNIEDILEAINLDKKKLGEELNIIILKEIGNSKIYKTTAEFFN